MKNVINTLLILLSLYTFCGCKDFELPKEFVVQTDPNNDPNAIGAFSIKDVSTATATLTYKSELVDKVIFHYTSVNGTHYTFDPIKDGHTFIAKLPMLKANTQYTCYAQVDGRRTKEETFTTKPHAIAEPIDLGLSVKWASWNVGATSIDEPGGLYGYGDITETQFSTDCSDYPLDSKIWGGAFDIARTKWGKNWRMPTYSEMQELVDECEWIWKETYYKVVGPNGNYIFFPISGYRESYKTYDTYLMYYWTGEAYSPYETEPLFLSSTDYKEVVVEYGFCYNFCGMSIRPVYSYTSN